MCARRSLVPRSSHVIQTQVLLAIVGAVIMLVVAESLARAFAIVGAAGLVRYRAKIQDPKDAGVMLVALAAGLAVGSKLILLATISCAFVIGVILTAVRQTLGPARRFKPSVGTSSQQRTARIVSSQRM